MTWLQDRYERVLRKVIRWRYAFVPSMLVFVPIGVGLVWVVDLRAVVTAVRNPVAVLVGEVDHGAVGGEGPLLALVAVAGPDVHLVAVGVVVARQVQAEPGVVCWPDGQIICTCSGL